MHSQCQQYEFHSHNTPGLLSSLRKNAPIATAVISHISAHSFLPVFSHSQPVSIKNYSCVLLISGLSALQRICSAEYSVPNGVELSPELEGLLQAMLDPEPERRIPVAQILRDPWFAEGLPSGVADMNARLPDGPKPGDGQVGLNPIHFLHTLIILLL